MGLLTPARSSGRRRYTIDDVYRVAATLRGKRAGLSLDQIEQVIITTDPTSRTGILRAHREELQRRTAAIDEAEDHRLRPAMSHATSLSAPTIEK
jgi:DNA-binding transcriptional MerR regulator